MWAVGQCAHWGAGSLMMLVQVCVSSDRLCMGQHVVVRITMVLQALFYLLVLSVSPCIVACEEMNIRPQLSSGLERILR